jgi:lysylphosphatidylglycerol synthetase-like protein (DUF2156 family)
MFDFVSVIISFFVLGFLVLIILVIIKFFHSLVTAGQSNNSYDKENDNEIKKSSREDSEADLAMTTDDEDSWMFPPEFDESSNS